MSAAREIGPPRTNAIVGWPVLVLVGLVLSWFTVSQGDPSRESIVRGFQGPGLYLIFLAAIGVGTALSARPAMNIVGMFAAIASVAMAFSEKASAAAAPRVNSVTPSFGFGLVVLYSIGLAVDHGFIAVRAARLASADREEKRGHQSRSS